MGEQNNLFTVQEERWQIVCAWLMNAGARGETTNALAHVVKNCKASSLSPMMSKWFRNGSVNIVKQHERPAHYCLPKYGGTPYSVTRALKNKPFVNGSKRAKEFIPHVEITVKAYMTEEKSPLVFTSLEQIRTLHDQLGGILQGFGAVPK